MINPTSAQLEVRGAKELNLLLVAPAGCGKTEALAMRVAGLLERGDVPSPRRLLVTTFTKRARDNILLRLRDYVDARVLRDRVTVVNFHGLAARIFQAHANVIGLDPNLAPAESDWVSARCKERDLRGKPLARTKDILSRTKLEPLTDEQVEAALRETGDTHALEIERQRVAEGRLTYDDLPRLAELILANEGVADLYQEHFACAVVDEFQDLTPQQLRIVDAVGAGRTTFAGDLAQGIYRFSGGEPELVLATIQGRLPRTITFDESHRSSPSVLDAVNAMALRTGGITLRCAEPSSWEGSGLLGVTGFGTAEQEAKWAVDVARELLRIAPGLRIGVLARTAHRRVFADRAFAGSGVVHFRWDDPMLDVSAAKLVRATLAGIGEEWQREPDLDAYLRAMTDLETIQDPDVRTDVVAGLEWVNQLLQDGMLPAAILGRIKVGDDSSVLEQAGVHLLSGHAGKGQQFDWVLLLGAEEDCMPDFRAETEADYRDEARVFSVMLSRARHGVVVTHAARVGSFSRVPSRFLGDLQPANPRDLEGIRTWLNSADWPAIASR